MVRSPLLAFSPHTSELTISCASLDSGSMSFEEGGSRIDDLKLIVSKVAQAASVFDDDGIEVRFMNSRTDGHGLKNEADAMRLINQVKFSGLTPLGTVCSNFFSLE